VSHATPLSLTKQLSVYFILHLWLVLLYRIIWGIILHYHRRSW